MNKLTIEQKAKAYDEVFKWMENVYPTLSHEQQMEAEVFFPIFKESEDERIRTKLLNLLKELLELGGVAQDTWSMTDCEQFIAWLEKAKGTSECLGEQKTVEWSGEDEKIKNTAISFLEEFKDKGYENAVMCIEWLKSLRPQKQWKPTEEQLKALDFAARNHDYAFRDVGHIDNFTQSHLFEILEQLKAL